MENQTQRTERPERSERPRNEGGNRRRRKVCQFCVDKAASIDFKDAAKLRKYVSDRGKILPRRITGNCFKHQKLLAIAVKRARILALVL